MQTFFYFEAMEDLHRPLYVCLITTHTHTSHYLVSFHLPIDTEHDTRQSSGRVTACGGVPPSGRTMSLRLCCSWCTGWGPTAAAGIPAACSPSSPYRRRAAEQWPESRRAGGQSRGGASPTAAWPPTPDGKAGGLGAAAAAAARRRGKEPWSIGRSMLRERTSCASCCRGLEMALEKVRAL